MANKKYTLLLLAFLAFPVSAEVSYRASIGYNCADYIGDGAWMQEGLFHHEEKCDRTWSVGVVGDTGWSWLRWSVEFADRGKITGGGVFVSDARYAVGDTNPPYYNNEYEQKTKALVLALEPTWRVSKDTTLFARLGPSLHYTEITHWLLWNLPTEDEYNANKPSYRSRPKLRYKDFDVAFYYALGVKLGNVTVEGYVSDERIYSTPAENYYGMRIGVEF